MPTITVYGASDDLIEIEGDISEEFSYQSDGTAGDIVAFSDGTVLRIRYDGDWRIVPVIRGTAELSIKLTDEDDDGYTDRATLTGDIRWVIHGIGYASRR